MRRRELLGALSVGVIGSSAGCLSGENPVFECSPFSRSGLVIENVRSTPQSLHVSIRTEVLERDVFSSEFDVPTAADSSGPSQHPGGVYEEDVLPNTYSLIATVEYGDETLTHSWQVACDHLYISIRDGGELTFTTISPDLFESMVSQHN